MPSLPSWAVVGTMDEPSTLVLCWVAHHLQIGADEVHVFLDRANPKVVAALSEIEQVHVTTCDETFWATSSRRARPIRFTSRQTHNAAVVQERTKSDWVLHCDADEFLRTGPGFLDALENAQSNVFTLRSLERVRMMPSEDIFAGAFRQVAKDRLTTDRIYGRWADFLEGGMAGFNKERDIVRSGETLAVDAQFTASSATRPPHVELEAAKILHFDGLTPLHSVLQLLKHANELTHQGTRKLAPQRERLLRFAKANAAKPMQMRKMIEGVFGMTPSQARALGPSFVDMAFDPRPAISELNLNLDLSIDAFDAELREREAELIARTGLRF